MLIPIPIIIIMSILFIVLVYLVITLNKQIAFVMTMPPKQTIFDPLALHGMKVINHFIKVLFLKYLNNKLIQLNEQNQMSITKFLTDMVSVEEVSKFSTGFVLIVNAQMSNQLKSFFNKYYNVLDKNGEPNDNFYTYISEWVISFIRSIQSRVSAEKSDLNYSIQNEISINSKLFVEIELTLYKELNIISDDEINNNA